MRNLILFAMTHLNMMFRRSPDVSKPKKYELRSLTTLEDSLDEIIPWVKQQVEKGLI